MEAKRARASATAAPRIPTLLQFHLNHRRGDGPAPLGGGTGDVDARARVMGQLITKHFKLVDTVGTLSGLLGSISDPKSYDDVALRRDEAREEASFCRARYDAIDARRPFKTPPESEEDALLAAIDAVDRSVKNTKAVAALLTAVHGLVEAYAAKDTE